MLLILEIILTIVAWNRGWKWFALIPVGITFCIGFMAGLIVGSTGGSVADISWVTVLDIMAVIALIVMIARKKETEKPKIK